MNAEDDGAESDSSLPSLQSVSDSSDEEDYISESGSEWDDDESLDDSEEEADIARLVEEAEAAVSEAQNNPTGPNPPAAAGVLPDFGPTPNMFQHTLQSYRELLDRAVGRVIPRTSDFALSIINRGFSSPILMSASGRLRTGL